MEKDDGDDEGKGSGSGGGTKEQTISTTDPESGLFVKEILQTHIWQEYLNLVEQLRKTERGKELYAKRKETIKRAFADAKEKHGMRYTHHRGLARVTSWVKLKYAAMNLKKLATWSWKTPCAQLTLSFFSFFTFRNPILAS